MKVSIVGFAYREEAKIVITVAVLMYYVFIMFMKTSPLFTVVAWNSL